MDEGDAVSAQLRDAVEPAVDALRQISDPVARVAAVNVATAAVTDLRTMLFRVKRDTLAQAYDELGSWAAVGARFELAPARARQLVLGRDRR